jgi:Rieske Fe-S protein
MLRRAFVLHGLMLVGFGRRVWAQLIGAAPKYFPLTRPVRIPLQAVKAPWEPVLFTAEAMAPATATFASRRVLISGVLFRRSAPEVAGSRSEQLSALCLTCPHEQCKVDLVTDPVQLARMTGGTATHPLFECACHLSVFDALQDGARVSGESPRGLYRFRITGVNDGVVEINEVEEVALFEV